MSLRAPLRRRALLATGLAGAALASSTGLVALTPRAAKAGAQIEEPLSDTVRSALSAAVAEAPPPRLEFANAIEYQGYTRWRERAGTRLTRHKPLAQVRAEFLDTVWYESRRAGLETALVLGLIQVESAFRKYAISPAGARGYMQVMPFWARLIGDGDERRLFHLQSNLRYGCAILRHYLERERGDLFLALGRYNGSRGRAEYPRAVFAARERWADV